MEKSVHAMVMLATDDSPSYYGGMPEQTRLEFLECVWALVRIWGCSYEQAVLHTKNLEAAVEWTKRGWIIPEVE